MVYLNNPGTREQDRKKVLELFRGQEGVERVIEPADFAFIGVKAAIGHKRAYDPLSRDAHYVDTPGPCTSNLASLPWRELRRPVWPVDAMAACKCRFS